MAVPLLEGTADKNFNSGLQKQTSSPQMVFYLTKPTPTLSFHNVRECSLPNFSLVTLLSSRGRCGHLWRRRVGRLYLVTVLPVVPRATGCPSYGKGVSGDSTFAVYLRSLGGSGQVWEGYPHPVGYLPTVISLSCSCLHHKCLVLLRAHLSTNQQLWPHSPCR